MKVVIHSEGIQVEVWELEASCRPKYVTGDVDNYQKAISDGLNGFAYLDDKQIHHLEVFFSKEPLENDEPA
jgi:Holliday junction resolvase RusA-like endonuclease